MKFNTFLFVVVLIVINFNSCSDFNTLPNSSCDKPKQSELTSPCEDVLSSTQLIIDQDWSSLNSNGLQILNLSESGMLSYFNKEDDSKLNGEYISSNYEITVYGITCDAEFGEGNYSYSISFNEGYKELLFKKKADECKSRVQLLSSNSWKIYYQ